MQYNVDFDIGSENGTKHYLNAKPVIPRSLNDHMNLITRVIVPVIYQDDVFGDSGSPVRGLETSTPSFFFSPKEPVNGSIVGAGAGAPAADRHRRAAGPLRNGAPAQPCSHCGRRKEGWTYGALVNHIWSFAGDDDRNEISSTFIQPFVAKQFSGGRTARDQPRNQATTGSARPGTCR